MKKAEVLKNLKDCGVIAVVRGDNEEQGMRIIDSCIQAGITGIEVTFTVPGALHLIETVVKKYDPSQVLVGAGTVLDPETARAAILSGANYVVSPCLNVRTVELCNRYQVACIPGAMTIKEVVECMEAGGDIVKVFPGNLFGPSIIKAIKGPLPQAEIIPTGGVNAENAAQWIRAGAVAVGAGSDLTAGAKNGDYDSIVRIGRQFISAVREARESL